MRATAAAWARWWLDGISPLLPRTLQPGAAGAGARLYIEVDDGGNLHIHDSDDSATSISLPPTATVPALEIMPEPIRKVLSGERELVLLLPADMTLGRRLQLPMAAASEIRQVLGFEIDRCTPFQQEEVYFDYKIQAYERNAGHLDVEFRLVPRQAADPVLDRLHDWKLTPHRMDTADETGHPGGWNLLPQMLRPTEAGRGHGLTRVLAATAVGLLLANLYLPPVQKAIQARALEREAAMHTRAAAPLHTLREEHAELLARSGFVSEQRSRRPAVIMLLAELTRLLPDDSWLERFSLQDGELQLQGQSSKPAALIPKIESSTYFTNTQFRAPITRNDRTLRDHFHLSTRLNSTAPLDPI